MKNEIIFRKAEVGDETGIAELFNYGLKTKKFLYMGSDKLYDKEGVKKLRKRLSDKSSNSFNLIALDNDRIIGRVFFHGTKENKLKHRVEFGWMVHPDYQGRGIGTKLLNLALKYAKERGFKKADTEMSIKNIPSFKLAKKCGFKIEGTKKVGMLLDNGKYSDTYIMGKILK
ncbi:MAG: GNAT family protein [Candidatus Pacearchaeota archaeon]|jgi:RimJ/RimL family protein N-acetyltransferase